MDKAARKALSTIRRCIDTERFRLSVHFRVRLAERGFLWVDVQTLVDAPTDIRGDGVDDADRDRWILSGHAADGTPMGLVCVIDRNEAGELVVFVTAFWEDTR